MVEAKSCTRWVWSSWGFHLQQLYRGWGCSPNYICGEQIWVLEMLRMLKCHIGDVTQFWHPKFMENDVFRSPHEFQVTNCFDIPTHTLEQGSNIQFQDVSGNYPYLHWFINSKKPQPPQPSSHIPTIPPFWRNTQAQELARGRGRLKTGGSVRSNGPKPTGNLGRIVARPWVQFMLHCFQSQSLRSGGFSWSEILGRKSLVTIFFVGEQIWFWDDFEY